jgi:DNA replication protein DnaC
MSIKESAYILRLPFIRNNYEECAKEARLKDMSFEEFLEELLKNEVELRNKNSIKTRIRRARFPYQMILPDYRRDHLSTEIRHKIMELETLEFIDNKQNIILIGNPGTGKTALSIALGMEACQQGKKVLFMSIPNLLIELKEAMNQNQITMYKRKFESYDLVILDELGYCTFDQERGEILFNLLSSRNEKGAMIITSNLTFDRWNEVFKDPVLTGAIIDRLAYMSHLIDMSGNSYRTLATQQWNKNNTKKD